MVNDSRQFEAAQQHPPHNIKPLRPQLTTPITSVGFPPDHQYNYHQQEYFQQQPTYSQPQPQMRKTRSSQHNRSYTIQTALNEGKGSSSQCYTKIVVSISQNITYNILFPF